MTQTKAQLIDGKSASVEFSSGAAGTPSITFSGDTNTGLFNPVSDTLAISTNAVQRLTVNSSGNVGIATSTPDEKLAVNGAIRVTSNAIQFNASDGGVFDYNAGNIRICAARSGATDGAIQFFTTASGSITEKARLTASGQWLVGTSTARSNFFNQASTFAPQMQLEGVGGAGQAMLSITSGDSIFGPYLNLARQKSGAVGGNTAVSNNDVLGNITFQGSDGTEFVAGAEIAAAVDGTPGANDMPGRLVFSTTADGASSPTERMRIANNGQILSSASSSAGITGGGAALNVSNTSTSTSGVVGFCSGLGSAGSANNTNCAHFTGITQGVSYYYLYGNGTSSFTSDARKKKNIETTRDGYLEDLARLRVVKYNWINQADGDPKELGLIAQEVEKVFPGLVQDGGQFEGDNFSCKVLKGSVLPFMLLKALQEAAEKIATLEAKVAALESA